MREYVEGLISDAFNEVVSWHVGAAITQQTLCQINYSFQNHISRLYQSGLLLSADSIHVECHLLHDGVINYGVSGLMSLPRCPRVKLVDSYLNEYSYRAVSSASDRTIGYCDGPNSHGIALVEADMRGIYRRPIPVVVEEINGSDYHDLTRSATQSIQDEEDRRVLAELDSLSECFNKLVEGYWVEAENQDRHACLFCDANLKILRELKGSREFVYKVCETCDKRGSDVE